MSISSHPPSVGEALLAPARDVEGSVELAARSSQLLLRALTNASPDAIVLADEHGVMLSWNPAATRMFGYEPEEAIGRPIALLIPEDLRAAHQRGLARVALTDAQPVHRTVRLRGLRKDGQEFPLELSLGGARSEDGLFFTGILRDVTDRERQAEAHMRADQLLRDITDALPDAVYYKDTDSRYVMVNRAAALRLGGDAAEIIGRTATDFLSPEAAERALADDRQAMSQDGPFSREVETTINSVQRNILTTKVALRDAVGRPTGVVGFSRDVTSDRSAQAERAARARSEEGERQYRLLAETMPQIVWSANSNGEITYLNPQGAAYTGATHHDLGDDGFVRLLHPDERTDAVHRWRRALAHRDPFECEYRIRRASDDSYRWHLIRAVPSFDESGHVARWMGTCTDIHDQRSALDSLRQWETAFRHSGWGVVISDASSRRIVAANPAYAGMHGVVADSLQGVPLAESLSERGRDQLAHHMETVERVGRATFESEHVRADGSVFPVSMDAMAVRDDSGRLVSIVANCQDLTEQKRLEAARTTAEERFRAVQDASPDSFVLWDMEFGSDGEVIDARVAYANPTAVRLLRQSASALVGQSLRALNPALMQNGRFETYVEVFLSGRPRTIEIWHDSLELWLRLVVLRVGAGVGVIATDISAHKNAETILRQSGEELELRVASRTAELAESEARFRSAFEHSALGVVFLTPEGRCLHANRAFCEMLRYDEGALRDRELATLTESGSPDGSPWVTDAFEAVGGGRCESSTFEARFRTSDGTDLWGHVSVSSVRTAEGDLLYLVAQMQNVTVRKFAEDAVRASERRLARVAQTQSEIAGAGLDAEHVMALVASRAAELTNAESAVVELLEGREIVYRAAAGDARRFLGLRLDAFASFSGTCARTGEVLRCDDTETDPRVDRDACRQVEARSMVVVPLRRDAAGLGVLKVYSPKIAHFGDQDVRTLELLAGTMAGAIANAAAFQAEQQLLADRTAALAALGESERRFREILDTVRSAALCLDERGNVTYCNDALLDLTGWTRDEVIGRDWFEQFVPAPRERRASFDDSISRGVMPPHEEHEILTVTGARRRVRWDHAVLRTIDGRVEGIASLGTDVTDERAAELARERLTAILDAAPDTVALVAVNGSVSYLNAAGNALLGVANMADAAGRLAALNPGVVRDAVRGEPMRTALRQGLWTAETTIIGAAGAVIPVSQTIVAHRDADGGLACFSTIIRDISDRKVAESELRALSLIDELTGLNNRRGFALLAEQQLRVAHREVEASLLFYFDVDDFKVVNDTWGHAEGDLALRHIAKALRATFRASDIIARLGGDEFAVLAPNCGDVSELIAARLQAHLDQRLFGESLPYRLRLGTGVTLIDAGIDASLDDLLTRADTSLYEAKRRRKQGKDVRDS